MPDNAPVPAEASSPEVTPEERTTTVWIALLRELDRIAPSKADQTSILRLVHEYDNLRSEAAQQDRADLETLVVAWAEDVRSMDASMFERLYEHGDLASFTAATDRLLVRGAMLRAARSSSLITTPPKDNA